MRIKHAVEVFWRFLLLGCVSFGGPAAHIGYFRQVFVEKRQWLSDEAFAKLLALSQFLPGPGSSQLGFAIGMQRAGIAGGVAAFLGFTLPSFLLMWFIATVNVDEQTQGNYGLWVRAAIHGLKLLAVVVVADAVYGMFKSFCQTRLAVGTAVFTAIALLLAPSLSTQIGVLAVAALVGGGAAHVNDAAQGSSHYVAGPQVSRGVSPRGLPLLVFFSLLLGLPVLSSEDSGWYTELFAQFYQAGSLVFGGGHVVLPLLQQSVGTAMPTDQFLIGYAAAQAVPGPMFTLATFLGAELSATNPALGALVATLAIFLPGFLLLVSLQGAWQILANNPKVAGAVAGVNAAVVGLLATALYTPIFISAVFTPRDMACVLAGLFLLRIVKLPIVYLVVGCVLVQMGGVYLSSVG